VTERKEALKTSGAFINRDTLKFRKISETYFFWYIQQMLKEYMEI